jgi:SAM-dependent methyltransferase
MSSVNHDVPPGPLERCQITGGEVFEVIDLGAQPPCDALLEARNQSEAAYPLGLTLCPGSGLAQLSYVVPGEEVYPPSYPYRSGISKPLATYQRAFADSVIARGWFTGPNPLVLDVGSNDGTLLTGFKARGWRAFGIEPTNVAQIAREENGIATLQAFFTEAVAKDVVVEYGRASVVTMTNVFAHMADLGSVMRALGIVLAKDGVFISETHYLLDVLQKNQFDTIYHEHVRTYSLKSLCVLVEQYGMEVFDVERGDRYGGNIRVYVARAGQRPVSPNVEALLGQEQRAGLFEMATWRAWRGRVEENRDRMMEFMYASRRTGGTFAGCSAPGRASTVINYYGIRPDTIPYLGELPNSLKLGKFMPQSRIPILRNTEFATTKPDYIVLFAWHYAAEIITRLRSEGIKSRLIVPLPTFEVIE